MSSWFWSNNPCLMTRLGPKRQTRVNKFLIRRFSSSSPLVPCVRPPGLPLMSAPFCGPDTRGTGLTWVGWRLFSLLLSTQVSPKNKNRTTRCGWGLFCNQNPFSPRGSTCGPAESFYEPLFTSSSSCENILTTCLKKKVMANQTTLKPVGSKTP